MRFCTKASFLLWTAKLDSLTPNAALRIASALLPLSASATTASLPLLRFCSTCAHAAEDLPHLPSHSSASGEHESPSHRDLDAVGVAGDPVGPDAPAFAVFFLGGGRSSSSSSSSSSSLMCTFSSSSPSSSSPSWSRRSSSSSSSSSNRKARAPLTSSGASFSGSGTAWAMPLERNAREFFAALKLDFAASSLGYALRTSSESDIASLYMAVQVSAAKML
mmetsp:Transcript_97389/g.157044  ORF Transcript_97389/g.157044 Transcript_97389/m.157044 type:complete len:220 (-) Transcript_97389:461-1120(-)